MWAGRAADPFYVDLTQVFAINAAVKNGAKLDLSGWRPELSKSSFAGTTIHAMVLEVADQDPHLGPTAASGCGAPRSWRPRRAAGGR